MSNSRKTDQTFDLVFDRWKEFVWKMQTNAHQKGIYISTKLSKNSKKILAPTTQIFGSKKVLFPIPTISKKDIIFSEELVETGKDKPVLNKRYTLEQINSFKRTCSRDS